MILGAAMSWAHRHGAAASVEAAVPQTTLTGWMMLLGWLPIAVAAPLFDPHPLTSLANMSGTALVRDPLQHLPCRHARALGVVLAWRARCRSR